MNKYSMERKSCATPCDRNDLKTVVQKKLEDDMLKKFDFNKPIMCDNTQEKQILNDDDDDDSFAIIRATDE